MALIDFGLAGYFALESRWTWEDAVKKSAARSLDGATLFGALFSLLIIAAVALTGCLILRKRWFAAAVGQTILTICLAAYTGLALLWLLFFGPGKHQDPQNGVLLAFALTFTTLVSLVDGRRLFGNARASNCEQATMARRQRNADNTNYDCC